MIAAAECQDPAGLLFERLLIQVLLSELHHSDTAPQRGLHLLFQSLPSQPGTVRDCIEQAVFHMKFHSIYYPFTGTVIRKTLERVLDYRQK